MPLTRPGPDPTGLQYPVFLMTLVTASRIYCSASSTYLHFLHRGLNAESNCASPHKRDEFYSTTVPKVKHLLKALFSAVLFLHNRTTVRSATQVCGAFATHVAVHIHTPCIDRDHKPYLLGWG